MMKLVMTDSGDPLTTSSGSAVTRRGRPGDVTATGADREQGCGGQALGDAGGAPRAPHCVRIITNHQKDEPTPPSADADVVR